MKSASPDQEKAKEQVHRVRITVSSKNVKNLEKVCAELLNGANNKKQKVEPDEESPEKVLPINSCSPYATAPYNSRGRNKRSSKKGILNFRWSPSMTQFLLPFLVEQARLGLKVNRTFRREALLKAAKAVNERFKVKCTDGNVENHLRTIKTRYQQIRRLQSMSDTSWDDSMKKIIMDPAMYGSHIMANPRDEPFLNKPIDMYDEIVILCSDEPIPGYMPDAIAIAANGDTENAEESPTNGDNLNGDDDVNIVMDDGIEIEEENRSKSQQVSTSSDSTTRTKEDAGIKIQQQDRRDELADKIGQLAYQIGQLAEAIKSRGGGISSELFTEVMKCEGYDEASLERAFDYLHKDENLARGFLAKNRNLRQAWLTRFFTLYEGQMRDLH